MIYIEIKGDRLNFKFLFFLLNKCFQPSLRVLQKSSKFIDWFPDRMINLSTYR